MSGNDFSEHRNCFCLSLDSVGSDVVVMVKVDVEFDVVGGSVEEGGSRTSTTSSSDSSSFPSFMFPVTCKTVFVGVGLCKRRSRSLSVKICITCAEVWRLHSAWCSESPNQSLVCRL